MTPRSSRVERRRQETRERIVRAAIHLFETRGFAETTIADITEAADIGKGTFFTYFATKEAVFGHLGETLVEAMSAAVEAALEEATPVGESLAQMFSASAAWHTENRPLSQQISMAAMRSELVMAEDAGNQRRFSALLRKLVEEGIRRGELRPELHPEDAVTVLGGMYFGTVLAWLTSPPGDRPLQQRFSESLRLILEGMKR